MTDQQHPITPPPELVRRWLRVNDFDIAPVHLAQALATQAARWGSDQELEACCECINDLAHGADAILVDLRTNRRPKPPSLKDEALKALRSVERGQDRPEDTETIRRALEQLNG